MHEESIFWCGMTAERRLILTLAGLVYPAISAASGKNAWQRCVNFLNLPTDAGMVAFQMRGSATVVATVRFDKSGNPGASIAGGNASARQAASFVLETSSYKGQACSGKSIELKFTFVVVGSEVEETYLSRARFVPPNEFITIFRPRPPIIDSAPPAGPPSHK